MLQIEKKNPLKIHLKVILKPPIKQRQIIIINWRQNLLKMLKIVLKQLYIRKSLEWKFTKMGKTVVLNFFHKRQKFDVKRKNMRKLE